MTEEQILGRIRDNLDWAECVGPEPLPWSTAVSAEERAVNAEALWARVVRLWGEPDETFVRGIYEAILYRPPDPEGLALFAGWLAGGRSRAEVVRALISSHEFGVRGLEIDWLPRLDGMTADGMWAGVRRLWPAHAETFVRGLYELLLHREGGPEDLIHHLGLLADGTSRAEVVARLVATEEFAARGLDSSWLPRLATLTPEGLWEALVRLWELPDEAFIHGLYDLLLHRPADPAGFASFRQGLADGGSRADLVRFIVASDEFVTGKLDSSWLPRLDGGGPAPRAASRPPAGGDEGHARRVELLLGQLGRQQAAGQQRLDALEDQLVQHSRGLEEALLLFRQSQEEWLTRLAAQVELSTQQGGRAPCAL